LNRVSAAALDFRHRVEDEARFLETCEGGDPGTPEQSSIWVLGIEPGWSLADALADEQEDLRREAQMKQYSVELQMQWRFNRGVFKLLSAIEGSSVDRYVQFAERARPFERGSKGYLKANLFPEPFNNVGDWDGAASDATGFCGKAEYRSWLQKARFAVLRGWIERCRPKLVIGAGLTHLQDFLDITGTSEAPPAHRFEVNGHGKRLHVAVSGTVPVAIVPHFTGGPHGLNSDESIGAAADYIRDALQMYCVRAPTQAAAAI